MNRKSALWFLVSIFAAGCGGSPATECDSVACGTTSYQVCASDGKVEYKYGSHSCSCDGSSAASNACASCLDAVEAYCGVEGNGGTGGTGGGGGSGSAGGGGGANGSTCSGSFLGGFSGTLSSCAVTVTQTSSTTWTIASPAEQLAGSQSWSGFTMINSGTPAIGAYDDTASTSTSAGAFDGASHWTAGFGQGATTGDLQVEITSLGTASTVGGNTVYAQAHGAVTGELVDSTGAHSDLFLDLTF